MNQPDPTNKIARVFTWFAWLLFLAVVAYGFDDFLKKQWNPNQNPDTYINNNGKHSVILQRNSMGHYVTNGEINGQNVIFLLDTGATEVSIPEQVSNRLNLLKQNSFLVNTANGQTKVYKTYLSELRIGEIILYNVSAHINPSMDSDEILLGMSALKQLELHQSGKQLTINQHN